MVDGDNTSSSSTTPTSVAFGLASYAGAVTGVKITSIKTGQTHQEATVLDESGDPYQTDDYGIFDTITVDGTICGTDTALVRNATLTISNVSYTIRSVDRTRTNTAHPTITITAQRKVARTSSDTIMW